MNSPINPTSDIIILTLIRATITLEVATPIRIQSTSRVTRVTTTINPTKAASLPNRATTNLTKGAITSTNQAKGAIISPIIHPIVRAIRMEGLARTSRGKEKIPSRTNFAEAFIGDNSANLETDVDISMHLSL
jgi:hypothetical protein